MGHEKYYKTSYIKLCNIGRIFEKFLCLGQKLFKLFLFF